VHAVAIPSRLGMRAAATCAGHVPIEYRLAKLSHSEKLNTLSRFQSIHTAEAMSPSESF